MQLQGFHTFHPILPTPAHFFPCDTGYMPSNDIHLIQRERSLAQEYSLPLPLLTQRSTKQCLQEGLGIFPEDIF